jgi:hypothetical protein
MITRRWQGVTVASKADAYLDYLHTTGFPTTKRQQEIGGYTSWVGWREARRIFSCSRSGTPVRQFNEFPL